MPRSCRDAPSVSRLPSTDRSALAQPIIVPAALALLEQDLEALGHVNPQEAVEVADDGRERRERDGLGDAVRGEVFAPERGDLEVELDHKGAVDALRVARRDVSFAV